MIVTAKNCPVCQTENALEAVVCEHCGAMLGDPASGDDWQSRVSSCQIHNDFHPFAQPLSKC